MSEEFSQLLYVANMLEVGGRTLCISGENLPPELQRIAEEELGETDRGRADALARLNQLLEEYPKLNSRRDNEFLLRFIRVRKYNVEAALATIKAYYKIRVVNPSRNINFLPSDAKLAARHLFAVLPERDLHGRRVLLIKLGSWMPTLVSHCEAQQAFYLVLEYLAADPSSQIVGISLVFDFEGFSMDKLFSVDIGLLRRCVSFGLKCVPFRVKAIHVVRQSYIYNIVMSIVKHVVSGKHAKRIHIHGYEFGDLHKEIPANTLPEEYGGSGPPLDHDAFWNLIDQQESLFVINNSYGYIETSD